MVYECGDLLGESERFPEGPRRTVVDVDLDRIRQERLRQGTFEDNRLGVRLNRWPTIELELNPPRDDIGLRRKVDRFPFVPDDVERLALDCYEAYNIQVSGLVQRLTAIGQPKVVIGVSGGLDSTHALIVAARAMDRLERPRSDIARDHDAGLRHRRGDQVLRHPALQGARSHLRGARHPPGRAADARATWGTRSADGEEVYDVTFENVQAGLRTDYLFRIANQRGGIVLGTGDLSELALGLVHVRRR